MSNTKKLKIMAETKESGSNTQSTASAILPVGQDAKKSIVMVCGTHDFARVREMPGFIDKTLLIDAVLRNDVCILLLAPRRFGKSVNISMLKYFLEILPDEKMKKANRKLFEKTLIEECDKGNVVNDHFGKYPVIFLDFRSPNSILSFDETLEQIRTIVHEAYEKHVYLGTSDELNASQKLDVEEWCDDRKFVTLGKTKVEIANALKNLAKYLKLHWKKKVFVLVDEYDSMCSSFILETKKCKTEEEREEQEQILKDIVKLCAGMLECLSKGLDEFVHGIILTGISHIMTVGLSNLNNVTEFRFQENHEFVNYYGMNRQELRTLLEKLDYGSKYDDLIDYYNGYNPKILSTYSIMRCLNAGGKTDNYWKNSGAPSQFYKALHIDQIRSIILKLLANYRSKVKEPLVIDYFQKINFHHLHDLLHMLQENDPSIENVDIYLNLLIEQGYFSVSNIIRKHEEQSQVEIQIPNKEIYLEFDEQLKLFCKRVYRLDFDLLKECAKIFNQLNDSDDENEKLISKLFVDLGTLFRTMKVEILNEASFHHIVYLISIYSDYKCFSELYVERNRTKLDILILTRSNILIILELKFGDVRDEDVKHLKNADVGLNQILKKNYLDVLYNKNREYIPKNTEVKYFVLAGFHISIEKSISLSVLLNNTEFSKKINYPKIIVE